MIFTARLEWCITGEGSNCPSDPPWLIRRSIGRDLEVVRDAIGSRHPLGDEESTGGGYPQILGSDKSSRTSFAELCTVQDAPLDRQRKTTSNFLQLTREQTILFDVSFVLGPSGRQLVLLSLVRPLGECTKVRPFRGTVSSQGRGSSSIGPFHVDNKYRHNRIGGKKCEWR